MAFSLSTSDSKHHIGNMCHSLKHVPEIVRLGMISNDVLVDFGSSFLLSFFSFYTLGDEQPFGKATPTDKEHNLPLNLFLVSRIPCRLMEAMCMIRSQFNFYNSTSMFPIYKNCRGIYCHCFQECLQEKFYLLISFSYGN